MSAGDIVFMHRQSSYNMETGVGGSRRWSEHYYMPAQSDRSAEGGGGGAGVGGELRCNSACIQESCCCCRGSDTKG